MSKKIVYNKKTFEGDNMPGKVVKGKKIYDAETVIKPNLYKMSSTELQKWQELITKKFGYYAVGGSEVEKEFNRIVAFIWEKEKRITLTDKDFIEMIKKKRGVKRDIKISGLSLVCGTKREIAVEYY